MRFTDRLQLDWLAWSYSLPYRWAHHPLCSRFHSSVVRIGKYHLCRSCLLIWLGAVLSGCIPVVLWLNGSLWEFRPWLTVACVFAASIALVLFHPRIYLGLPRILRDMQRFSAGIATGSAAGLICAGWWFAGVPVIGLLLWGRAVYLRGRGQRKLHACDGCAELDGSGICSGVELQARLMRRFEERAAALLEDWFTMPPRTG